MEKQAKEENAGELYGQAKSEHNAARIKLRDAISGLFPGNYPPSISDCGKFLIGE